MCKRNDDLVKKFSKRIENVSKKYKHLENQDDIKQEIWVNFLELIKFKPEQSIDDSFVDAVDKVLRKIYDFNNSLRQDVFEREKVINFSDLSSEQYKNVYLTACEYDLDNYDKLFTKREKKLLSLIFDDYKDREIMKKFILTYSGLQVIKNRIAKKIIGI